MFVGDGNRVLAGVLAFSAPAHDGRRVLGVSNFHILSNCLQNSRMVLQHESCKATCRRHPAFYDLNLSLNAQSNPQLLVQHAF